MSDNTILGGPSRASDRPAATGATPEDATEPALAAAIEAGDPTTAYHRGRLYSLLAIGFERPGDEFDALLDEGVVPDHLLESADAIGGDVSTAASAVADHLADREALYGEWVSLFGIEEGITVSPYELRYLPGPLMTTIRKLADIRGFYRAFDLAIEAGQNDRGDHVCFLLEFLGHLSLREAYLRTDGDDDGVAVVVDAQRRFLEDHLGRWYWRFADEVASHDDGFYAALAELLAALVEGEVDRLDLDPDWVPDDPMVTEWNEGIFGDAGRDCGGCGFDTEGLADATEFDPHGHLVGDGSE